MRFENGTQYSLLLGQPILLLALGEMRASLTFEANVLEKSSADVLAAAS